MNTTTKQGWQGDPELLARFNKTQKNSKWQICHRFAAHNAWTRLSDGERIYCVYPVDEIPTPTSGGYPLLESALKLKGLSLPKPANEYAVNYTEQRDTAQAVPVDWQALAISRYDRMEEYRVAAQRLAEALKETIDALYNETTGKDDSPWISSVKTKSCEALADYDASNLDQSDTTTAKP